MDSFLHIVEFLTGLRAQTSNQANIIVNIGSFAIRILSVNADMKEGRERNTRGPVQLFMLQTRDIIHEQRYGPQVCSQLSASSAKSLKSTVPLPSMSARMQVVTPKSR